MDSEIVICTDSLCAKGCCWKTSSIEPCHHPRHGVGAWSTTTASFEGNARLDKMPHMMCKDTIWMFAMGPGLDA